jgi:hypothetical protein
MLIAYKANVAIQNNDQENSLFFAARMHNHQACLKIIPILLCYGAGSQSKNKFQNIPYFYAPIYHRNNQEIGNMLKDKEGSSKAMLGYLSSSPTHLKSYDELLEKFMLISYN